MGGGQSSADTQVATRWIGRTVAMEGCCLIGACNRKRPNLGDGAQHAGVARVPAGRVHAVNIQHEIRLVALEGTLGLSREEGLGGGESANTSLIFTALPTKCLVYGKLGKAKPVPLGQQGVQTPRGHSRLGSPATQSDSCTHMRTGGSACDTALRQLAHLQLCKKDGLAHVVGQTGRPATVPGRHIDWRTSRADIPD
jgi:hypothetical protein